MGQMSVGELDYALEHYTNTQERDSLICGQQNIRATVEDNTGQNTKATHPVQG